MYKKTSFSIILTLSIIIIIVALTGCIYSIYITSANRDNGENKLKNTGNKNTDKSVKIKKLDKNSYNILVMGDSLAKGTGDEKSRGFAKDFSDLWKSKAKKPIDITNISVNGDVSDGLLNIVKNQQNLQYIQDSNMIFISIGGNEIKNFKNLDISSPSLESNGPLTVQNKYINNLEEIFKLIRNKNQNCMIVFIGLYNPFGNDLTSDKLALLEEWNSKTEEFVSSETNTIYIPTYDLFKYNSKNYLSGDNFHPNSLGYQSIARRIFESLKSYDNH